MLANPDVGEASRRGSSTRSLVQTQRELNRVFVAAQHTAAAAAAVDDRRRTVVDHLQQRSSTTDHQRHQRLSTTNHVRPSVDYRRSSAHDRSQSLTGVGGGGVGGDRSMFGQSWRVNRNGDAGATPSATSTLADLGESSSLAAGSGGLWKKRVSRVADLTTNLLLI